MITLRPAQARGHANHGWLDSYHSFSFADYYHPQHMGVSKLRVINEDTVAPGTGFGTHSHADMEIISYILSGALQHKDSMGNGSVIRPGEVQLMSAGSGVRHSEYNASNQETVNFLQIWILPDSYGIQPGYQQQDFSAELPGRLRLVASPDGHDGSLLIHQDILMYATRFNNNQTLTYDLATDRKAYIHVATGALQVNGISMSGGDGATIMDEQLITLTGKHNAEALLFDLP